MRWTWFKPTRRCALPWPNDKLMGYDYISVGEDGFVLISVKPAIGVTRLAHDL
jgi:hypothetical protein